MIKSTAGVHKDPVSIAGYVVEVASMMATTVMVMVTAVMMVMMNHSIAAAVPSSS